MNSSSFNFGARHLFYLIRIYRAKFDSDLRAGRFSQDEKLKRILNDLLELDMIGYDGQHMIRPCGVDTIGKFIGDDGEKSLPRLSVLLEVYFGMFDDRLQAGKIEDTMELTLAIGQLLEQGMIEYCGVHKVTTVATDRISKFVISFEPSKR
jgi:hypothetical protein